MKAAGKAISLILAFLMLSVLFPGSMNVVASPDTWTFMVYLDADNELETYALKNFMQMSEVGSSANVNIIVQMDRIATYNSSYGGWSTCRRFYVTRGMTPTVANSLSNLGEVNMGNPATLVNFVTWANTNYPADRMVLMIWDHGDDWEGACYDETDIDTLTLPEIRSSLSSIRTNIGKPLDIVGFDACEMGSVEVGHQIRQFADYYVASEAGTPLLGFAYDRPLWALTNDTTMAPLEFANQIVSGYRDFYLSLKGWDMFDFNQSLTLSTVDLGTIGKVVAALKNLSSELRTNMGQWVNHITLARNETEAYNRTGNHDIVDLYDLVANLRDIIPNATVKALASAVIDAVNTTVRNEMHQNDPFDFSDPVDNAHGMSVYFPANLSTYDGTYSTVSPFNFTQDSQWDSFLSTYYTEAAKGNPTVMYASPSGANASLTSNIAVQFSEPMSASSLAVAFSISPQTGGSLGWNASTNSLVFTTSSCLAPSTQYSVKVNTSATDLDGKHLQANYSWVFKTRDFATLITLNGEHGEGAWYVSPVNVTLSTTDPGAVNWTWFRINNASWENYSLYLIVGAERFCFIEYYSETLAGYRDQVKNATILMDLNAPSSVANVTGRTVSISVSDAASGVNRTTYRVDGGAWQAYSSAFYVNASGNHTVEYYSVDNAGNVEEIKTAWVDATDFLASYGLLIAVIVILVMVALISFYLLRKRKTGKPNE